MLVCMMARCAWLAVATTLLACSSSGNTGGNCSTGACGGNLVGSWKITGSCSSTSAATTSMSTCPNETIHVNSTTTSGTLTFNADMTYTTSVGVSGSETATVPLSCLSTGGTTGTCDELAMVFNSGIFGDAGTSSATCTMSGSNCDCNIMLSVQPATATGTYSASGDSLTTMSAGGGGRGTYCVQGNTLTIISSPDGGTGLSDLVATKQ